MNVIELEKGAKEVVLPPGSYVIGDPCYHVPDNQWDHVLDESGFFAMGGPGTGPNDQCWATFRAFHGDFGVVVAFGTAEGDGLYKDYNGREYGVDAGLIGIIPLSDIDPGLLDLDLAHLVVFTTPVVCFERNGVLIFGHVEINTAESQDDDEEGDDDPCWNLSDGHGA